MLIKPCFHWQSFSAITSASATRNCHYRTCLVHLGRCDIDRIISIGQTSPMYTSLYAISTHIYIDFRIRWKLIALYSWRKNRGWKRKFYFRCFDPKKIGTGIKQVSLFLSTDLNIVIFEWGLNKRRIVTSVNFFNFPTFCRCLCAWYGRPPMSWDFDINNQTEWLPFPPRGKWRPVFLLQGKKYN